MIERNQGHSYISVHPTPSALWTATLAYDAAGKVLSILQIRPATEVARRNPRNMISPGVIENSGAHGMIVQLSQRAVSARDG